MCVTRSIVANIALYLGLLGITLLSACQITSVTEQIGSETPEQITRQYIKNVQKQDWKSVSLLFHDESLREFKRSLLPIFIDNDASHFRDSLFGKITVAEVKKLDPHIFFSAFLKNVFAGRISGGINDKYQQVIGGIAEGVDLHHVLIRTATRVLGKEASHKDWQVISLKPEKNSKQVWRILVGDKLKRHAHFIKMKMLSF
jgi:hypothetical protein